MGGAISFHVDFSILQHKLNETSPIQCQKRRLASVTERNFLCAVIKPSQCHSKSEFSLSFETVFMRFCLIDRISNQSDGNDFFLCMISTRFKLINQRIIKQIFETNWRWKTNKIDLNYSPTLNWNWFQRIQRLFASNLRRKSEELRGFTTHITSRWVVN